MPIYEYKGLTTKGKPAKGLLDADGPRSLKDRLKREGIFLSSYVETRGGKVSRRSGGEQGGSRDVSFKFMEKVKLLEVSEVTRQISTLVKSGIPVVDSIGAVSEQLENPLFKRVLTEVRRSVNEGASLSSAMKKHPKVFSHLYVNMVAAGEQSGTLGVVFSRLSDFMESQVKLRSQLSGALMYPAIMMVLGFAIVMMMMLFVIPQVQELFEEMGADLPLITKILIGVSELFQSFWWLMIGGGIGGLIWFKRWKKTKAGKAKWDAKVLKFPIFGHLIRLMNVARFARTLETLLAAGVPILNALGIVRNIVSNESIAAVLDDAKESVKEGHPIADALKKSGEIPPMCCHMVAVGERSGQLEEMLANVADSYEMQVESKVGQLTSVLEPVMIVFMGVGVAFMAFAIILPMLKMNQMAGGMGG